MPVLSDKLFFWLFQGSPDRILSLLDGLPADAAGYTFSAPVLKQREYRLDGLFLPPANRPYLPALILEAQMGPDPVFLRRLYAETARLLQQEPEITNWRVVVISPSRQLNFGPTEPVAEFLERRVSWVELQPECWSQGAADQSGATIPLFQRLLGLLLQPEEQIKASSSQLRQQAVGTAAEAELDDVIAAILVSAFQAAQSLRFAPWAESPSKTSPKARSTRRSWASALPKAKPAVRPEAKPAVKPVAKQKKLPSSPSACWRAAAAP
ncbi:DUF2887 domain-containing protein [Synechococcus sp. 1G10]|uniref:DUF2887 domain-containing protein n=1 Tax=Synechococcus sp. 1G10 TaxID=2025605 RepID=UPI000B99BD0F|nr:DUF2887 domain-containing protein [Synechococcus sp. 1G10]